jgi:hypothetical protein
MSRRRRVARTLLMIVVGIAATTVPISRAAACSCMGFTTPEEVVAAHEVTFIGTVVDTALAEGGGFGGRNVRYAFDVERASAPTEAMLVVQATDDGGGASCGIAFGVGERWLISASRQDADLQTSLCSNNLLADDLEADQVAAYTELLPNVPPEPAEPAPGATGSDVSVPIAIGAAVVALFGLAAVSLLALRGRRTRPD